MPELTDHDILTTLSADFRNLKDSQDIFHKEMKESISDLKNNYASRLDLVENQIKTILTKLTSEDKKIKTLQAQVSTEQTEITDMQRQINLLGKENFN
jgi:hypothetical protein